MFWSKGPVCIHMLYQSLATQIYFYEYFFTVSFCLFIWLMRTKYYLSSYFIKLLALLFSLFYLWSIYIQNIDTKSFLYIQWLPFYCLKNDFELAFRLEILECLNSLFLHERCIAVSLNMTISGKVSGGFFSNVDQGKIIILKVLRFTKLCNYYNANMITH